MDLAKVFDLIDSLGFGSVTREIEIPLSEVTLEKDFLTYDKGTIIDKIVVTISDSDNISLYFYEWRSDYWKQFDSFFYIDNKWINGREYFKQMYNKKDE